MKRDTVIASAFFLAFAILLFVMHANRVVVTNDEGILLEPAQRIAFGARPYVDFWAFMSPGSYWLQAAVFRVLGVSLAAGRVPVILDVSLQIALVFWLASRLVATFAATSIALIFAAFQIADPASLTAQHRWDSGTLALAGIACAISASSRTRIFASGALLAAAAWCTPAVGIVGAAVALWLVVSRERRNLLLYFVAGVAAVSALAAGILARQGCFHAFLDEMLWLRKNYSAANIMPYGAIIGGYCGLFEGASGVLDVSIRALAVICLALPAILPPLALIAWAILRWRGKISADAALLLLCLPALVATVFPRADVPHLAFVAAIPYVLAGSAVAPLVRPRLGIALAALMLALSAIFAANFFQTREATVTLASPAGNLRVSPDQREPIGQLLARVHPGETLFVYPYMPLDYFLTQAVNPTRYAYLNPGMSTHADELAVLGDLQAHPPKWVLYLTLTREEFLRVFPHGGDLDWHFATLESWLQQNYRAAENPPVNFAGYQLWERTPWERADQRE
jgi:hypothetical protein